MKNVSNAFKKVIKDGGPFYAYAKVTLSNGTQLELNSKDDFYISGNNYTESSESGFPLGVAVAKTIDIGIDNSDERFSNYDFYYARIAFYTEADLEDGRTERILEGTFTVVDSIAPGDTIEFTASNDMYKADITYVPKASFPATALIFLKDVCTQCGIRLGDAAFVNDNFEIQQKPDGLTCRQAIGYVAQIAGGNAIVDENNNLHIKSYQSLGITNTDLISGGTFKQELNKRISGGSFGQDTDFLITSGDFNATDDYIMLTDFSSDPDVGTDDVTITGLATEVEVETEEGSSETSTLLYGTDDYCLKIDNPLIKGNEEKALRMIGDILIGLSVRPFSGSFFPNPTIEFMDPVYLVDRKNNVYRSFVSSFTFNYLGDCTVSNDTKSPERNKGIYYSNATEMYRKAKEEVKKNKAEWEKAMEDLADRINNSSGLYMTKEEQEDGSSIYYMHDKPTLEESMIVWKMTAEAMAVSTDGGKTWNAGLTVDGDLITKIMSTIGLNFDWGVGGTLIIQTPSGEQTLYVNAKTGEVHINGLFTSEELYGGKRKGLTVEEGTIRGFYGSTTTGLLDLSAMYDDGDRHVALKGYDYLHLQAGTEIIVEDYISFIDSVYFNNSVEFTNWVYFTSDVEFEYKSHFRKAPELYNLDHVSSGGHIVFGSDGVTLAYLASSSKRYKNHVKDMTDRDAEKLLDIHVVWFKYKDGYLSQTDHMCGKEIPGFYAEELNDVIPDVVQYDKDGKPEDWNYRAMIPYMVQLLKKQNEEIKELKNEVNKLKGMIRSD